MIALMTKMSARGYREHNLRNEKSLVYVLSIFLMAHKGYQGTGSVSPCVFQVFFFLEQLLCFLGILTVSFQISHNVMKRQAIILVTDKSYSILGFS